jgi:hypothetical protein
MAIIVAKRGNGAMRMREPSPKSLTPRLAEAGGVIGNERPGIERPYGRDEFYRNPKEAHLGALTGLQVALPTDAAS